MEASIRAHARSLVSRVSGRRVFQSTHTTTSTSKRIWIHFSFHVRLEVKLAPQRSGSTDPSAAGGHCSTGILVGGSLSAAFTAGVIIQEQPPARG